MKFSILPLSKNSSSSLLRSRLTFITRRQRYFSFFTIVTVFLFCYTFVVALNSFQVKHDGFILVVGTTRVAGTARMKTRLRAAAFNQQLGKYEPLSLTNDDCLNNKSAGKLYHEKKSVQGKRLVKCYDFILPVEEDDESNRKGDMFVPFREAWKFQKELVDSQLERLASLTSLTSCDGDEEGGAVSASRLLEFSQWAPSTANEGNLYHGKDSVIMLQHEPVYTLGTGSDERFIKETKDNMEIDIVRIERGGEVTYHGPGQLTVYPILDLRGYKQDIHWYVRALEEVIIRALHCAGIDRAQRETDVTGVWVDGKKVAAVGVKVRRWVTMHGIAVNVDYQSLSNFGGIVPCGLEGRSVACINDFLEKPITVDDFKIHMRQALESVFQITLGW